MAYLALFLTPVGSYFVTELLGTDLHRLLSSRKLENQFIQVRSSLTALGTLFATLA